MKVAYVNVKDNSQKMFLCDLQSLDVKLLSNPSQYSLQANDHKSDKQTRNPNDFLHCNQMEYIKIWNADNVKEFLPWLAHYHHATQIETVRI